MSGSSSFRFSRADFGPLLFYPLHYDLHFTVPKHEDLAEGERYAIDVISKQTYLYQGDEETSEIVLDGHTVEVKEVSMFGKKSILGPPPKGIDAKVPDFVAHVASLGEENACTFSVDEDNRKVHVKLATTIKPGDEVAIKISSRCFPDEKTLEGIYYDYTPPGAPQQMISQCQQYGFQRIVPSVDRMASKTFYTTTIVADERYTNIVSNGDLAPGYTDDSTGAAKFKAMEGGLKEVVYYNHKVNMAPYLFFWGCGTYDTHVRELEYPTGEKCTLELLCLPGVVENAADAEEALRALHDSVLWVQISTGPEQYEHEKERKEVYRLIEEREALKESLKKASSGAVDDEASRLEQIRSELRTLMAAWGETGYTYTGSVYREIAMENSNYGGMENVGNTTILSSRLTPSRWLVDGGFVYLEGVKVHEFYHNINGSQTTGASPFEIWLNEAVTVHIQREREDAIFGHDYMRLRQVAYARTPGTGPLAQDNSPVSMPVEPEGFNTTHELISAMTYSKAPEFVRMVQMILGKSNFVKALHEYHCKYAFSNATTMDWIECMNSHSPVDLRQMATGWLGRCGYPTIRLLSWERTGSTVTISLQQSGFADHPAGRKEEDKYPWIIPIDWALVKDGKVLAEGMQIMDSEAMTITVSDVGESPDFVSLGRDFGFFGEIKDEAMTPAQRVLQAKSDPDVVNRYLSFQSIADKEKAKIVEALRDGVEDLVSVSADFVDLCGTILSDESLSPATRAMFLSISSSVPSRPDLSHYYKHLSVARKVVVRAVYKAHSDAVHAEFVKLQKLEEAMTSQRDSLKLRPLKHACYDIIRTGLLGQALEDGPGAVEKQKDAVAEMARKMLSSRFMSDKSFALRELLELGRGGPELAKAKAEWTQHPIGCEQYIACISSVDSDNAPQLLRELICEPFFKMALAGHARTVARGWSRNRKRSLLTSAGLELTKELFLKIGKVNQMSAYSFLSAFDQIDRFKGAVKETLMGALKAMQEGLDKKKQESLFNQLARLMK